MAKSSRSVLTKRRKPLSEYRPLQRCFVITSLANVPELESAYKNAIVPAVEALGLGCARISEVRHTGRISERVERSLRDAYFVIADLTLERPNCYYELGFAQALRRPAIIVARAGTVLHFDVADYPCIFYEDDEHLRRELSASIIGAVLTTEERDPEVDIQNGEFGRLAVRNGRLLTAKVLRTYFESDDEEIEVCDIRIDVIPLGDSQPLKGAVRFFVDPSYTETYYTEQVIDGYASLELEAVGGAFTVGARVNGSETKLELDLATIPGAPVTFYP